MVSDKWNYPKPAAAAVHEAAHAVVATLLGCRVHGASIRREPPFCEVVHFGTSDREKRIARHGQISMAGIEGESLLLGDQARPSPTDRKFVKDAALELAGGDEREARRLIHQWRRRVCAMLMAANREFVELAVKLTEKKVLRGREIRESLAGVKAKSKRK